MDFEKTMTDDLKVFDHLRAGRGKFLIVGDHASNSVPRHLGNLGLSEAALEHHIAWDVGTLPLAHALSEALDAEAIISNVSRLVIDKNRRLDQPGLMPDVSDAVPIPGNRALTSEQIQARIDAYYHPYHAALAASVARKVDPILLSLHTFTPVMDGFERPWECGFLYNKDNRLAAKAIMHFKSLGFVVGDNEPYPGNVYNATMDRHAEAFGHPYLMIEIRNDLLRSPEQVAAWQKRFTAFLTAVGLH